MGGVLLLGFTVVVMSTAGVSASAAAAGGRPRARKVCSSPLLLWGLPPLLRVGCVLVGAAVVACNRTDVADVRRTPPPPPVVSSYTFR
jgi:hypothetical protein